GDRIGPHRVGGRDHDAAALVDGVGEQVAETAVLAGGDAGRAALTDGPVVDRAAGGVDDGHRGRGATGPENLSLVYEGVGRLAIRIFQSVELVPDHRDLAPVAGDDPGPEHAGGSGAAHGERPPGQTVVAGDRHLDRVGRGAQA